MSQCHSSFGLFFNLSTIIPLLVSHLQLIFTIFLHKFIFLKQFLFPCPFPSVFEISLEIKRLLISHNFMSVISKKTNILNFFNFRIEIKDSNKNVVLYQKNIFLFFVLNKKYISIMEITL